MTTSIIATSITGLYVSKLEALERSQSHGLVTTSDKIWRRRSETKLPGNKPKINCCETGVPTYVEKAPPTAAGSNSTKK